MRPLAMLLGIVMGSTVSIAFGLALTLVVFALLPEYADRLGEEYGPLWRTFAGVTVAAIVAAASFFGEVRQRPWRRYAQAILLLLLAAVAWVYWPRGNP